MRLEAISTLGGLDEDILEGYIPIKTEDFSEDKNQYHADEYARLKHV